MRLSLIAATTRALEHMKRGKVEPPDRLSPGVGDIRTKTL